MVVLRLIPTLLTFLIVVAQIQLLSGPTYAQTSKPNRACCMAGAICPTPGDRGCKCCGFRVDAILQKYTDKKGALRVKGLEKPVEFDVTDDRVDDVLKKMATGKSGKFVLKLNKYEYPDGDIKRMGKRFECEGVVDKEKLENRTKEFVEGYKITEAIYAVAEVLAGSIPTHAPERDEDKKHETMKRD
jgi:hypothetical protein